MIVVGAGMAGLLAARMMSHRKPTIWETQKSLPNNHSAVLRFRTSQIGDILGIPFKRVNMIKDTLAWRNPIADSIAYSYKNARVYRSDRSVTRGLVSEERFIAPPDLIEQMARGVLIDFGRDYDPNDPHTKAAPIVSTIPMPALMELLNYDMAPDFEHAPGYTITALLSGSDAYCSLLVPSPEYPSSRVSITAGVLTIECPLEDNEQPLPDEEDRLQIVSKAAKLLGLRQESIFASERPRRQIYSKIIPIKDETRKEFMFWATKNFGIYSLGRFATWRPGLLLDDLVKDIRLIDGWIGRSGYDVALHNGRR